MSKETMFEKMRGTRIPDYYTGMHNEGWKPWEILEAARNAIIHENEAKAPMNVRFQVEVKTK